MPKKTASSRRWLAEHFNDPFVLKAQKEGYRSRAAYKLLEIQKKDRILKPGMKVVDLGAAPGGWTQVVVDLIGSGTVVALDILPMDPVGGATVIQGDFTEDAVLAELNQHLQGEKVDIVLSDMAPNMSGQDIIDQPKGLYLAELALDFALHSLKKSGTMLIKIFQGAGFDHFLKQMKKHFSTVQIRKPEASRSRSKEVYLLARGFKA